jgi:hypothetical protein
MICSSEKRFFTSNLLVRWDWTPDRRATQKRGNVARPGVGRTTTQRLYRAGFRTLAEVAGAPDADLLVIPGVGRGLMDKIRSVGCEPLP